MFSRTAFIAGRTPPVPEAFPESAKARGKKKEEAQPLPHSPFPGASRSPSPRRRLKYLIEESSSSPIRENTDPDPLDILGEVATSSPTQTNIPDSAAVSRRAETRAYAPQPTDMENLTGAEKISSIAAGKGHWFGTVQKLAVEAATNPDRNNLCRKVGEMLGEDLAEVTIFPMLDIDQSDEAMIARVKDLVLSVSSSY